MGKFERGLCYTLPVKMLSTLQLISSVRKYAQNCFIKRFKSASFFFKEQSKSMQSLFLHGLDEVLTDNNDPLIREKRVLAVSPPNFFKCPGPNLL